MQKRQEQSTMWSQYTESLIQDKYHGLKEKVTHFETDVHSNILSPNEKILYSEHMWPTKYNQVFLNDDPL